MIMKTQKGGFCLDHRDLGIEGEEKLQADFLLVLMCPIWPQLAHFRCVPVPFVVVAMTGELGELGDPAGPSTCIPFCLSRATLRSLFRSSLASSFSKLTKDQSWHS